MIPADTEQPCPERAAGACSAVRCAVADWFGSGSRSGWVLLCTLLCATLPMFFSWPRVPVVPEDLPKWELYWSGVVQAKIDNLLFDYREVFAGDSNEAKRNYRLTLPLLARLSGTGLPGVHAARFLLHFGLLLALVLAAERACRDRTAALAAALAVSGTYVGTSAWRDVSLWFDNCAHAFVAISLVARHPVAAGLAVFLGILTDERALLAVPLVFAFHAVTNSPRRTLYGVLAAVPAYLLLRIALAAPLGFFPPTAGIAETATIATNVKFAPLVYWFALEGGWIALGIALLCARKTGTRVAWALAALLPIVAATAVGDFTRSASYGFPATLLAFAIWRSNTGGESPVLAMRRTAAWAAIASLAMPNVAVMKEIVTEQSLPGHVLVSWLQRFAQ